MTKATTITTAPKAATRKAAAAAPTLAKTQPIAQRSGSLADGTRILAGKPLPAGLTSKQTASLKRLGIIEKG